MSYYSEGFPVDKVLEYQRLRKPFVTNDMEMMDALLSRLEVNKLLEAHNIPRPKTLVCDRRDPDLQFEETPNSRVHKTWNDFSYQVLDRSIYKYIVPIREYFQVLIQSQ